uniref:Transmembrane protein 214 n=1 Tax=Oncorhynchus kisutch TaxID=8019 RepID=A0A8C7H2Z4_ONCKI
MASNNSQVGKWEVVKKSKKPGTAGSGGKNLGEKKTGRKALSESNMTRTDQFPPLVTSGTLFEAFEKMGKKHNKEQVPPAEPSNKKPSAGKQKAKLPPASTQTHNTHKNLEDAFKAMDVGELKQQLDRSQTLFPDNPSVWVKDLAGYLNHALAAPETDPTLSSYTHGEPLHGYRVCIQAILQDKPRMATQNLPDYLELLRSVQNRPVKCLTIMWSLGQAGYYDLSQGLRVWLGIMLPVLGVKALSSYAIAYLERLLLLHVNLTKGFGVMGPKDFFPLLDFAYMPKNALSPSLQEQLCRLYPRLKVLAFGAKPEMTLHTYLPSFLSRATPHCPEDMKRELLSSMTECLSVDHQSLGVWRQLYTKHLPQSSLLLNHLLKSWNTLPPKLRGWLQETVQSFRVTNEELRDTANSTDLQDCNKLCHCLQLKMSGRGFPWSRLFMALLVFAAGFITHDIRSRGSFTDSTTASYLHSSGVMGVSQQAWSKVTLYSQQGFSWLDTNTPYYYSECVRVLSPVLEQTWERTKDAAIYISQLTTQLIDWINHNTPLLVEWLSSSTPDSVFLLIDYLKQLLLFLHTNYLLPALSHASHLIVQAWTALQDSCSGEVSVSCLQTYALSLTNSTWLLLQDTSNAIKTWIQDLLQT